ncbi:MAG: hypothetical protein WKF89_08690 [Chitinophagaceae bacterium]
MTRFLYRLVLVGLFFFINLLVYGQKMDSMMNVYRDNFPQEKIHLHFDKDYYNPGETIWFKAYIMSGTTLSGISKNFYAELINDKGVVLQRVAGPVLGASAAASFVVPANFTGQYLHLRAFTSWMLNFDTSFLYNKNIRIVTAASAEPAAKANATSLQFFPEGGDLVAQLESTVAFKANDKYGLPVKVNGYIRGSDGKKIIDFVSRHNGMGSFKLVPATGVTYTAVWKDSTNKEITTPLPASKNSGLVLNASKMPGAVTFVVSRTEGNELLKQVHLLAHMDQQLVYRARVNLTENFLNSGRIPIDQLPSGVLQLTVFNSNWQPMAERIIFVNNNDFIFDTYERSVVKSLNKRGKNVLEIEIPDTLLSNLSLSVTDASVNAVNENEDNIYSRFLLTGDVKGYVHDPGYYFSSFADSVAQQLELVMLTHGWRRFKWEDLAQGKLPTLKFMPDNYLTLKGSLVGGSGNGSKTKDNLLNLIVQLKDSSSQFLSVPLLAGGKFASEPMVFYDTAKVFFQLNKDKRQVDNSLLNLENGLWKGNATVQLPENINEGLEGMNKNVIAAYKDIHEQTLKLDADRSKKAKMLEEVVVRGKTRNAAQKADDVYTSGLFKGGDGYSFDLTNDITAAGAMSVFNYLQGKVPGLMISNASGGNATLSWRGGSPDLFLNEMRSDPQSLSSLSMSDIAYIKVFRPPFMGAVGGGAGGAIAIYTKKGSESRSNDFVGLSKVTVMGYTPAREFYSPDYAQSNPLHELNDLRTTLYWEPFIFLDKEKKKTTVSFYNNDFSKKLRVVIEGVNDNGKLTRVESIIE